MKDSQFIIETTATYYQLTPDDLTGVRRTDHISLARHVAMFLLRQEGYSENDIGTALGGRDRSTVWHGVQRVKDLLKQNPDVGSHVREIDRRLEL